MRIFTEKLRLLLRSLNFLKLPAFFLKSLIVFGMVLVFIFTAFNIAGCDSKEKVIKIGSQSIFTGDDRFYGFDQSVSLKLAASQLSPVRVGGFEYTIEVLDKDDEGNAEKAFIVAQEFIEEGVSAVIGSTFNGTTMASLSVFSEYNIPLITPSAQGEDIGSGFENFYRMIINNSQKIENIAGFISETLKPSKLVLIDNNEEYYVKLVDHLIEIFENKKIEFLKRYSIVYDQEEYKTLAENLLIDEPDYIFFCGDYKSLALLMKEVRELGLSCTFLTEEFGMDEGITSVVDPEFIEGLLAIVPAPPELAKYTESKRTIDFWRNYGDFLDKTDDEEIKSELADFSPGPYSPYAFDALYIIIEAMKKANSIAPEDFSDFLKKTVYEGVTGQIEFTSKGDRLHPASTVFVMKNGDWVRYSQ